MRVRNWSANKSKSLSKFQQKALYVLCQLPLYLHLSARHICSKKIKQIWIFKYLIHHIRICWRKGSGMDLSKPSIQRNLLSYCLAKTAKPVKASNRTIKFLRFIRSARNPPSFGLVPVMYASVLCFFATALSECFTPTGRRHAPRAARTPAKLAVRSFPTKAPAAMLPLLYSFG